MLFIGLQIYTCLDDSTIIDMYKDEYSMPQSKLC